MQARHLMTEKVTDISNKEESLVIEKILTAGEFA